MEAELQLPPGAAATLCEVEQVVAAAQRAAAGQGEGKPLAAALPRLREHLRSTPRCRDLFAAAGGVQALLACYAEDNLGVLSTLVDAVCGCDRGTAALAAAADAGHAPALVRAVRDRRVAVICAAVDLLAAAAPASRATREALCEAPYAETLALMTARAPPALAHRAVALLASMAGADARSAAAALQPHKAALAEGLARMATPPAAPPGAPQRAAVAAATALCRGSATMCAALGASSKLCAALLALLGADAAAAPESRRLEFASGVALVFRVWERAPADAAEHCGATAALCLRLAEASPAWAACADGDEGAAWALLLPLLHAPPAVSAPATRLLAACAAAEPRCAAALAELGLVEPALALAASGAHDASTRDAAAALLSACAHCDALHRELLAQGADDERRGLPAACALLTTPRSGAAAVAALARLLCAAAARERGAQCYMAATRPHFARDVVRAWYARAAAPAARDALEELLMALLATDEGAAALAADADSEAHVVAFVAELRSRRAAAAARATGGASMLNPAALGMATPYALADASAGPVPVAARAAALAAVDAKTLARYLATLLPGGGNATKEPAVLVDASGGAGSLALRLAAALPGASVYAAERSRAATDFCVTRAAEAHTPNLTPVCCSDGLGALPLPAHVLVAALAADILADEPHVLAAAAGKLRAGGKLLLVEEDPDALAAAERAAVQAGLVPYAAPDVLNAFFVRVMQLPA